MPLMRIEDYPPQPPRAAATAPSRGVSHSIPVEALMYRLKPIPASTEWAIAPAIELILRTT